MKAALVTLVALWAVWTAALAGADPGDVQQLQPSLPSTPARDGQFLNALARAGLRVVDVPTAIFGGHETCAFLAADHHVALDAVEQGRRNNPTLTREQQIAYVNAAISVYCPRQTGLNTLA